MIISKLFNNKMLIVLLVFLTASAFVITGCSDTKTKTKTVYEDTDDDDDDDDDGDLDQNLVDENAAATINIADGGTIEGVYVDGDVVEVAEDATITLSGQTSFAKGSLLRIKPGVTVEGDSSKLSYLVIFQGAKISAVGTLAKPITFTSDKAAGSRLQKDWGGIVINGYAKINAGDGVAAGEGNSGLYGGNNDEDSSGTIKYVRVYFGGYNFSTTNELNGFCLQAVGSGTTVDYVQIHNAADDGIEMFGGSVNLKHIVSTGNDDDQIDCTFGWTGKVQYAIAAAITGGDKVFEFDNNEEDYDAEPFSNPKLYNVTGVDYVTLAIGAHMRRGAHASFNNAYFAGSNTNQMVYAENTGTTNPTTITLDYCLFENVAAPGYSTATSAVINATHITTTANPTVEYLDAANFASYAALETAGADAFVPQLTADNIAVAGKTPPDNGFFNTGANFIGAVENAANNWADGWTEFPEN